METLKDLLEEELKDLYSAEKQLTKALPTMEKNASSALLKEAFRKHLGETEEQVTRLERIGEMLDIRLAGKKCKAMEGLIEEGKEVAEEKGDPNVLDAAFIAAAQRVEHYEISAYGSARALAEHLGEDEVVTLLQETLDEESATDEALTMLCQEEIFSAAPNSTDDEGDEENVDGEKVTETGRAARQPVSSVRPMTAPAKRTRRK
jgi:ferritin-like metal-binding protein YciE